MINKISDEKRSKILKKSPASLPNEPSDSGIQADDLKKSFYGFVMDDADSVMSEIDRIVEEVNTDMEEANNVIETVKVNGSVVAVSDKTVNLNIPTKTSDIVNDLGFQRGSDVASAISLHNTNPSAHSTILKNVIKDISFETESDGSTSTGKFTVTRYDGSVFVIDTKLEKIAVNFSLDETTKELVLTYDDGTTARVSLTDLMGLHSGGTTQTIQVVIDGNSISANVLNGSITNEKLASAVNQTIDEATQRSILAKNTADEALTVGNEAKAVANKVREDFDQIAESELGIVQEKGQGTAVAMSQKAVTDALLETVEVSELSGEILTIPNTAEGALEDYRILGKSVQHISPNLFDVEKAKVLENWVNEDSFYYFDIMLKANTQYNFNCKENNGYGSNFNLAIISGDSSAISICNNGIEGANVTKRNFTTPSDGNVRLRLLFNTSDTLENLFANIVPQSQINEGTTALPYEPYTGTPSPDSPVEIQSVASPINVVSCGRNFLDLNRVKVFDNWVLEDNIYYFDIQLKPSTNYNFNCSENLGTGSNVWLAVVGEKVVPIINSSVPDVNYKKISFTSTSSGLVRLRLTNASSHDTNNIFVNLLPNCQINEGTTALPYEPYQSATTEITVMGEDGTVYPLRGIGDIHDEVDFDRNVLIQRVGEYVWSGEGVFGQQSTYDSDLTTVFFSSYLHANQNCKAITDNVERSAVLFDRFPIDMSIYTAKDLQGAYMSSNVTFRINKSIANDVDSFKSWLAENPVTVVYPLAEPVEIPLQTLPAIPTMDGTTTITTTNTPAPELYCTEYMDAQMGNPVTLKSLNEVINPVTSAELVYNRNTKNTVARDITELQMKNTDQDKQIDTLNEKLYSTDPTKVIPVKKAETANVVPLKYLLDTIYPVGSIYISTVDNSPMNFLGGTWTKLTGDAYLKIVTSGAGNYGGTSSEHKIPLESIPDHSHTYTKTNLNSEETHYMSVGSGTSYAANEDVTTGSAGGGQAYYPYYYGVYVWQRVPD